MPCGSTPTARLRYQIEVVDELIEELSVSTRISGISDELAGEPGADREALPEVYERFIRLNAEEPYRLKCSYIRTRLENTHDRIAAGRPHQDGDRLPRHRRLPGRPRA